VIAVKAYSYKSQSTNVFQTDSLGNYSLDDWRCHLMSVQLSDDFLGPHIKKAAICRQFYAPVKQGLTIQGHPSGRNLDITMATD
jgi:hypothetical protein